MSAVAREARVAWIVGGAIIAVLAGLVLLAGANPLTVLMAILDRALFTRAGLAEAAVRAIPLTIVGLGIAVAFRARLFNIGGDGQIIAGAALAVALAPLLPANLVGIVLLLALGALGGAIWGGIAGVLKGRFGANEIIVTIMLNYVAIQLMSWLVRGPLQERMGILPRSDAIDAALRLPVMFPGTRIHAGLLVALAAAAILAFVLARTRFGFRLSVLGENREAAVYAGQNVALQTFVVLALSGAFAGLAGAVEVAGLYGRLQEGFAPGFGIAAIAVALVARLNPLLVPVSAFGFSLLYVGLGAVARGGDLPFPFVHIIEAAVVLLFLVWTVLARAREVRRAAAMGAGA